jgi:hypothetical protein
MERAVSACPACGSEVRPLWPVCRACGELLMKLPEPVGNAAAPSGPPPDPGAPASAPPGAPPSAPPTPPARAEEQFYAPAVLQPVVQPPRAPAGAPSHGGGASRRGRAVAGVVAFVAAAGIATWLVVEPGTPAKHEAPVALAPVAPSAGLPSSLSSVVRMQAESSRRTALQVVESVGRGDLAALQAAQPGYQWSNGTTPSDGPRRISVGTGADGSTVTVAVEASNHDICAFGRWVPGGTPEYVTMEHEPSCRAASAPAAGWSTEAGGAASDLPDPYGASG